VTVLVTGADGFVGRWVVRALVAAGHAVVAAAGPGAQPPADLTGLHGVRWVSLDLRDPASVAALARERCEAVLHLAGLASGAAALRDPALAWEINAAGSARLFEALGRRRADGDGDPRVLVASTAEVYGPCERPLTEADPVRPVSPYAASKAGAELAARETAARTGLRVVTARAFPHTGPGQDDRFVAAAFARRIAAAGRLGARVVKVGNLDVTRDLLDVRDVADAYVALLAAGTPGETYNIASGVGVGLRELFDRLAAALGVAAIPETDASLVRPHDVPFLVGDATKLRGATGWAPRIPLDRTLQELVDAQAR
jgi:GDP-4-dehydro-6-deoxy-D-mannose reductase